MNKYKEECVNDILKQIEVACDELCNNCKECKEDNNCILTMIKQGKATIHGIPSCTCNDGEFSKVMSNINKLV